MARMRMISPRFFTDAKLFDAESASGFPLMLAFAGLWCQADREGRFEWKPRELQLHILPFHAVDFGEVLEALAAGGFVVRYVVGGKEFGFIPNFLKYQKPHKHETASELPPPPEIPTMSVEVQTMSDARRTTGYNKGRMSPDSNSKSKTESKTEETADASRRRPDTWLTPFIDAWKPLGDLQGSVAAKPLRALIRKHGARQVLATWKGYCDEAEQAAKAGRSFNPSPQHFARTYGTLKAKWAQVIGEHGDWEPIPDEPEEVAA